ncbi:MAG: ATP-binding protein [Thermodesulfobacteriota bacterium]
MQKKRIKSFQTKIVFPTIIVGILSVLMGMSLLYFFGNRTIEKLIGSNFKELAFETAQRTDSYIDHHLEESRFLAMSTEVLSILREREKLHSGKNSSDIKKEAEDIDIRWKDIQPSDPLLSNILKNNASRLLNVFNFEKGKTEPIHHMLMVTDSSGIVVAAINKPGKYYYAEEDWWKNTFNNGDGQIYIPDIMFSESIKNYTFDIATPVKDNGKTIGVILMIHRVEEFFKSVTSVQVGETDHTMLVSSDGTLLFCPIYPIRGHTLLKELTNTIFHNKAGWAITMADVHYGGSKSITGYAPVKMSLSMAPHNFSGNKWYIFTSQDPKETYAPIRTLLKWIAVLGSLSIGLLCLLEIYASKKVVMPIKMLYEGTELIGKGDLNHRLEIKSGDEIEELADKFNDMAVKLKASYTTLEQKVTERTRELLDTNKDMAILYDITSTMSSSLHLDETLGDVLKSILKSLGWGAGLIYLLDHKGEILFLASHEGLDSALNEHNTRITIDTYPYSEVIGKGHPFISEDLPTDRRLKGQKKPDKSYRAMACIPLRSKNKVLGALTVYSVKPKVFSKKVVDLLQSIGNQLGITIENAQLFTETEQLGKMKTEFVSHVSHELRTPLSSIKSAVEILLDYGKDDKDLQKEFLTVINSESDRLTRLITEILDISKIEANQIKWHFRTLNFKEVISESMKIVKALARLKKVDLKTSISKDIPLITYDKDRLLAVMANLLENALKFTEEGSITVGVEPAKDNNTIKVYVADTGRGIPAEDVEKIFEPFYQSSNILEGKPKGTGLGLTICQRVIKRHRGKIWVESTVGKGSTFFFTLPAATGQETELS